jgi:hypothetical protein
MHIQKIRWRYLLPGVILPYSLWSWIDYYTSVRASDDSPAPWYWYGGLASACLNFPAFIYSAFAQPLHHLGFRLGKLWIDPRMIAFFLGVFMFWYWVGRQLESWSVGGNQHGRYKRTRPRLVLLGLIGVLWIFVTLGTIADTSFLVHNMSWYALGHLYGDFELMRVAELIWSVMLARYYCRTFAQTLRARTAREVPDIDRPTRVT